MRVLLILVMSVAASAAPGGWTGAIWIETKHSESGKHVEDPKKSWRRDLNLSLDCKVENSRAMCALNGSSTFRGEGSSIDSSATGSVAPHVSASVNRGKFSLSIGVVSVRGKNSVTVGGTRMDEEKDMNFGPWRAEGAASPGNTQAGKWSDEKGITTITWRLTRRD